MSPRLEPPARRDGVRLLAVDPESGALADLRAADLPSRLRPGDLLVVNDAATLPASLRGRVRDSAVEVRLAGPTEREDEWAAVLFGAGDWRTRTEDRAAPPEVAPGDLIHLGALDAEVVSVPRPRLLKVRFDRRGAALWAALYAHGRPVQYSYHARDLALWSVQTTYAGAPWAMEMPSAGRPLTARVLEALRTRGVQVARVTHAAGLSATGDPSLDAMLPLPERYSVPERTLAAARAAGRVVAVGTSVVRALESAAAGPCAGMTDLRIGAGFEPRLVDGLLTGMHVPTESHFDLLRAFASDAVLDRALAYAVGAGYRAHEFGDLCLLLA